MTKQLAWFAFAALLALGCDEDTTDLDGSVPPGVEGGVDGGADIDAGPPGTDAGPPGADAGEPNDGGGTTDDASTDPDAGGTPSLTLEEFLEAWMEELCAVFTECEAKLGAGAIYSQAITCHPFGLDYFTDTLEPSLAAGTIDFDASAAADCLDTLAPLTCVDLFPAGGATPADYSCPGVFVPTVAVGGDCSIDQECVGGRCQVDDACPGTCVALAGAGNDCGGDAHCLPELTCIEGTCELRRAEDATCARTGECASGLVCIADSCQPRPGLEEVCEAGDSCAGDLLCSTSSASAPTCIVGAGEDESCAGGVRCAVGLRCSTTTEVCVPLSPRGGTCSTNVQCAFGTWCDGGACVPLPVAGESCALAPACAGANCVAGTCELGGEGDDCQPVYEGCDAGLRCWGNECRSTIAEGEVCTSLGDPCEAGLSCNDEGAIDRCRPISCAP